MATATVLGSAQATPTMYQITPQADRRVTLILRDVGAGKVNTLDLPVNPAQKVVAHPWRTTLTQSAGGIWIDNFGKGVPTLTISGDTGWRTLRGRYNGQPIDGKNAYEILYVDLIQMYFNWQYMAQDPDLISLYIVDNVDDLVYNVVPTQEFQLQRSKTDPLLFRYTATFIVIWQDYPSVVMPWLSAKLTPRTQDNVKAAVQQQTQKMPAAIKQDIQPVAPPDRTYTVVKGDTLWGICQQFYGDGTKAYALAKYNGIPNPNLIYPGQVLKIPKAL